MSDTLAQKQLIELLMWNASNVQKTPQLNLTGTVGWLEVRNCAKVIFLRPCSKDLCLFAVSDALLGFLIRMPKPSRVGTDCFSCLSLFLFAKWMMMTWNQRWKREQRKVRTGHAFPWLTGFRAHTHTLAQKYLIELLMWNASNVQKTPQLNLTGTVGWLEVRNCAKVIFLRPCSKD